MLIGDVVTGFPGSVHNAHILRQSQLYENFKRRFDGSCLLVKSISNVSVKYSYIQYVSEPHEYACIFFVYIYFTFKLHALCVISMRL